MPQTAIDLVHLARQTGGDAELERELLTLFAQQCARHLRTIHGGDAAARRDAAHTLKGDGGAHPGGGRGPRRDLAARLRGLTPQPRCRARSDIAISSAFEIL